jgi:hypothetical protein
MSKLTVDDLVQAQQQTDASLKEIIRLLQKPKDSVIANSANGIMSLLVFAFGAYLAFEGNLAGVCVCLLAISARIERLISVK